MTSASSVIHVSRSIRSTISRRSFAGSWIRFCALRKTTPSIPALAELVEQVPVVHLELVAVAREQALPVEPFGHEARGRLNGGFVCSSAIFRKSRYVSCSR